MGNTCATEGDPYTGPDGHRLPPYYDIKVKGCPSDPSEYFKLVVPAEVKRRYVLDHIRYTIGQRRKDQAFSRPLEAPTFGPDAIRLFAGDVSSSQAVIGGEQEFLLMADAIKALGAAADEKSLAEPFQPNLLDKARVVPELEEVTHERIVAALVRARAAVEAAFLTPMEAMVVEPEVKHEYASNAKAGGILKKKKAGGAAAAATGGDGNGEPQPSPGGSDENIAAEQDSPRAAFEEPTAAAVGTEKDNSNPNPVTLEAEANADADPTKANTSPPTNAAPAAPAAAAPPAVVVVPPITQTCIPWQVTRMSWLTTLELITMDTGDQLQPGQTKHTNRNARREYPNMTAAANNANNPNGGDGGDGFEQHEFSMLRSSTEGGGKKGGLGGGNNSGPQLIQTPSSTVEVAYVEFPLDRSVRRMARWSEEKTKMAERYAEAKQRQNANSSGPRTAMGGGGGGLKKKKTAGFALQNEANGESSAPPHAESSSPAGAAAGETEASSAPSPQKQQPQQGPLSHYKASLIARKFAERERLDTLYGMISTRPLAATDHPLFGGLWSNPNHPHVQAMVAARYPQLSLARASTALMVRGGCGGGGGEEQQQQLDEQQGNNNNKSRRAEGRQIAETIRNRFGNTQAHNSGSASQQQAGLTSGEAFKSQVLAQLYKNNYSRNIGYTVPPNSSSTSAAGGGGSGGLNLTDLSNISSASTAAYDATNRNAAQQLPTSSPVHPSAATGSRRRGSGGDDNRQSPQQQIQSHSPACLCQACIDKLWSDVDLRHLVNWPPTACVARPTVSVLSHTSAVEAVVLQPVTTRPNNNASRKKGAGRSGKSSAVGGGNSTNKNTAAANFKSPLSQLNQSGPAGDEYSADEGGYASNNEMNASRGDNNNNATTNLEFRAASQADLVNGPNNNSNAANIRLVRHHKATVAVLFYHHRLKTSNALQRRLLSEDTVSVPLLQPEASASSSMILGKNRDGADGNRLLARKARLQMLSNYRDLRTQQLETESDRRKKTSDNTSLNGGGREGNGASSLPAALNTLALSTVEGQWDGNILPRRIILNDNDNGGGGSANAAAATSNSASAEANVSAAVPTTTRTLAAIAQGPLGSTQSSHGTFMTVDAPVVLSTAGGKKKKANANAAAGASFIAQSTLETFHKSELPHYPRNGLVFSTSRNDKDVYSVDGYDATTTAAATFGGGMSANNAMNVGPILRSDASQAPRRLDAVDLVVEALYIELEAYEFVDGDANLVASAGGGNNSHYSPSSVSPSIPIVVGPTSTVGYAGEPQEVSLLSTLAPSVDVCSLSRKMMLLMNNNPNQQQRQEDSDFEDNNGGDGSGGGNDRLSFQEPHIMTPGAARGIINKRKIRAEKRKDFDQDDFINGKNNKADSKAHDNHEEVKTSLAIMMMASHYQSRLEENRHIERSLHGNGGVLSPQQQGSSSAMPLTMQQQVKYLQHDMSQFQSYLSQVAFQIQNEIWMKDLFPL